MFRNILRFPSEEFESMLPFLQFILALGIIIGAAKVGGYLSSRLGQPAVAGEVLAGLILGPSVLNFLNWPAFTNETYRLTPIFA